jgi:flavin-dependent dehydrogenase
MKSRFELIREDPVVAGLVEFDNEKLQGGVFPVTDVVTKFTYRNVVGIGDCVSQGSPLLGEGYRFIIESSLFAVSAVVSALENDDNEKLLEYDNLWNQKFGDMFRRHKKLQKLALKGCDNDLLGDVLTLLLKTKRASTFQKLLAGDTSRRNLLFP